MPANPSIQIGAFIADQGNTSLGKYIGVVNLPGSNVTFEDAGDFLSVRALPGALVPSGAGLSSVNDIPLSEGTRMWVLTFRDTFELVKASTAVVDGVTVIATASGVGRWLRRLEGDPVWTAQLNWDVNFVTGNDENSGLAGSGFPLKNIGEFVRRVRIATSGATYTVNVPTTGVPAGDVIRWSPQFNANVTSGDCTLLIKGTTTVAVASAFTATVATVAATNTQATVTDVTTVWAAQIGQIITMTSGPALGATAVVLKDLGAGVARVSNWVFPATGVFSANPAAGNTYEIRTLPTVATSSGSQGLSVRQRINFQDVTLTAPNSIARTSQFFGCRITFAGALNDADGVVHVNSLFGCSCHLAVLGIIASSNSPLLIQSFGGAFINCIVQVGALGGFSIRSVLQGCRVRTTSLSQGLQGGRIVISAQSGFFDSPAGFPAIEVRNSLTFTILSTAGATGVYGSGNGTYGASFYEGSVTSIPTTTTPTLTGAAGDIDFEGSATAIPELIAGAIVPAASALTTWANLIAAPFSRNVISYKNGTKIQSHVG